MPVVSELIRSEVDGTISFGNYKLDIKSKISDFEHCGDSYKVKTYKKITKLERNGMFVYESVPGTAVNNMNLTEKGVEFTVSGDDDAQITLELEDSVEYEILLNGENAGKMKTNLGGKLILSVDFSESNAVDVVVVKM